MPVVWGAVLVMALAAMADPLRIGITVLVISRPQPEFQLLAFWLGGVVMGLAVGLGVLFLLRDLALVVMQDMASTTAGSTVGHIQIVLGLVALLIAALIAAGFSARRRTRVAPPADEPSVLVPQSNAATAKSRLLTRAGAALRSGSPWVAFLAGAWLATPFQYVAALAAILASGAAVGTQVGAVVVYNIVVLAFAEIPLVSHLVAPAKTHAVMLQVHDWVRARRRQLVAVIVAAVGLFLVISGISSV